MSNANDFMIENGILVKYNGQGGNVIIPDGVTEIGAGAFRDCQKLAEITIPNTVTNVGEYAFWACTGLKHITANSACQFEMGSFFACTSLESFDLIGEALCLGKKIFSSNTIFLFPETLGAQIEKLYPHMKNDLLKQVVLQESMWKTLPLHLQAKIFLSRQHSSLNKAYIACIKNPKKLVNEIVANLPEILNKDNCAALDLLMTSFSSAISAANLQKLKKALQKEGNGAKLTQKLNTVEASKNKSNIGEQAPALAEELVLADLSSKNENSETVKTKLKEYYAITTIPVLKLKSGQTASPIVLMWLLTAHETLSEDEQGKTDVVASYESPGLCKAAIEVVSEIDEESLQKALCELADNNLGLSGRSKKMFLAYPICRYANESTMLQLTKNAKGWKNATSKNNAPSLLTFRLANAYSNTRAAAIFAEKQNDLSDYASLRGVSTETIRNNILANIGIDAEGKKVYDLGNLKVIARLSKEFKLTLELENGEIIKILPRKGADKSLYLVAKDDIALLKEQIQIVKKTYASVLFEAYLNGTQFTFDNLSVYIKNPFLSMIAGCIVWSQGNESFTFDNMTTINASGCPYEIKKDEAIFIAHPMEMQRDALALWQKYFSARKIKQLFEQIWEPVIEQSSISIDRYKNCPIPYKFFLRQRNRGIATEYMGFEDSVQIYIDNCITKIELVKNTASTAEDCYEIKEFSVKQFNRKTNHIISYLDKISVFGRIKKDDISIKDVLHFFTLSQITEFFKVANEANATNVMALLLEFKNENFADFDPMDEFTLDL